ncbi:hypothetical protein IQ254_03035 [Nodosilinea sp. LEGE 07088]|uniref:hypothetical protein n=1 Tax=Nodosilinea sp. LEGE 07088 TaxID=2777968 RepID=UPI0018804F94|nr:hypothetical protein [Nodosilinea sp. LEGE 07088]MBE9136185.1 hypothetical protein [Nodosilinea sp. LEGE 07088]
MTENQHNDPDNAQSTDAETFDARDLVNKGGYDKDPREIIANPAVTPQMPYERRDQDGVGMGQVDDKDSE